MHVQRGDALSGLRAGIDHQSIAVGGRGFAARDLAGHRNHLSQKLKIGHRQVLQGGHMFCWDDQDVHGRHRVNIAERHDLIIPMEDGSIILAANDPAKRARFC